MDRRQFLGTTAQAVTLLSLAATVIASDQPRTAESGKRVFRVWTMGCSHVGTDLRVGRRESLADAIRQSEQGGKEGGPPFDWDIALHLGDLSGSQTTPQDEEGEEVVRQFAASTKHPREHFYNIAGNHDASGPDETSMGWFRKWVDPDGQNSKFSRVDPKNRPYPTEGTWERYLFRVGNLLFLMMSDRNDGGPPVVKSFWSLTFFTAS